MLLVTALVVECCQSCQHTQSNTDSMSTLSPSLSLSFKRLQNAHFKVTPGFCSSIYFPSLAVSLLPAVLYCPKYKICIGFLAQSLLFWPERNNSIAIDVHLHYACNFTRQNLDKLKNPNRLEERERKERRGQAGHAIES